MTTFSIVIVTAFFIGLANACSLVPCSGNEIITSTALIKDTCDFIQPIKSCLSSNFLHAKMSDRKQSKLHGRTILKLANFSSTVPPEKKARIDQTKLGKASQAEESAKTPDRPSGSS